MFYRTVFGSGAAIFDLPDEIQWPSDCEDLSLIALMRWFDSLPSCMYLVKLSNLSLFIGTQQHSIFPLRTTTAKYTNPSIFLPTIHAILNI